MSTALKPRKLSTLHNGDILGVRQTTFFSNLTRIVQRIGGLGSLSGITHIGVASQIEGVWYSAEMDGKHPVLRPIEQLLAHGYTIEIYRSGVQISNRLIHTILKNPIKYSVIGNIKTGFHLLFRFNRNGAADDLEMHCADLGRRVLKAAGFTGFIYAQPSPAEVCKALPCFGVLEN